MPGRKFARFWMVWNPSGGPPRHRHETRKCADKEAARLARQSPGTMFVVLKAVGGSLTPSVEPKPVTFFKPNGADDTIPF